MLRALVLLLCLAFVSGCGGAPSQGSQSGAVQNTDMPDAGAQPDTFVAFSADFEGFEQWEHFPANGGDGGAMDPVHLDPTLVEYVNHRPPANADAFPIGTLIVKEGMQGDPATRQFFAMAKRGGTYNTGGALGWEWFELQRAAAPGAITIVWRGYGPPEGEIYGGNAKAGCNECHMTAPFDSVFASEAKQ